MRFEKIAIQPQKLYSDYFYMKEKFKTSSVNILKIKTHDEKTMYHFVF